MLISPQILVLDSDLVALEASRRTLTSAGFRVTTGQNGKATLANAETALPSLVICEAESLRSTRTKLCRLRTKDASAHPIPIIVLSAQASEEDRVTAFELGVDDYISKPFHARELILRVKRCSLARKVLIFCNKFDTKSKPYKINGL